MIQLHLTIAVAWLGGLIAGSMADRYVVPQEWVNFVAITEPTSNNCYVTSSCVTERVTLNNSQNEDIAWSMANCSKERVVEINSTCVTTLFASNNDDVILAYPDTHWGRKYMVTVPLGTHFNLTVASPSDQTLVTFTTYTNTSIVWLADYNTTGCWPNNGGCTLILESLRTVTIPNLTGGMRLEIKSNRSVGVFVTGLCQTLDEMSENPCSQQLTPVEQWGKAFVTVETNYPSYLLITARYSSAVVVSKTGSTSQLDILKEAIVKLEPKAIWEVHSNSAISVVQVAVTNQSNEMPIYTTQIVPVEQWSNLYRFKCNQNCTLLVTVLKQQASGLKLNGGFPYVTEYKDVFNYTCLTIRLVLNTYTLSHNNATFSAYIAKYYSKTNSYALASLGRDAVISNLTPVTTQTYKNTQLQTTMSTGAFSSRTGSIATTGSFSSQTGSLLASATNGTSNTSSNLVDTPSPGTPSDSKDSSDGFGLDSSVLAVICSLSAAVLLVLVCIGGFCAVEYFRQNDTKVTPFGKG